jgi:phage regulator Rha-like protein
MKNYITLILFLTSYVVFSQNQNIKTEIDSIVNAEVKLFKTKQNDNIIVVSDNLGHVLILSKEKLIKVFKNKKGCLKKRTKKLSKKQKMYFRECMKNYNTLKFFKNKECPERIRRCRKLNYSYYLNDSLQFSNNFFIDFDEPSKKVKIEYLLNLYDSILD